MWLHPDPDQALRLAVRLGAVGQLIGLVELFVARHEFAPGGFLDWSMIGILSPRTRTPLGSFVRRSFRRISRRAFLGIIVADTSAAAALLVWPASVPLIAVALVLQVALLKRHHLSIDGSDQMTFVVLLACCLGRLGGNPVGVRAAVTFLAAELSLSYLVAGAYKAKSPYWQSGHAFAMLVQTRMYGHRTAAHLVRRHPVLGHMAAFSVVVWESLFLLALTAPPPVAVGILVVGAGFHAGCGIIMGLNRFLWAFVASYSAFLCTNSAIRSALGPHNADVVTAALAVASGLVLVTVCGWHPAVTRIKQAAE
jgi:hypothetical protein